MDSLAELQCPGVMSVLPKKPCSQPLLVTLSSFNLLWPMPCTFGHLPRTVHHAVSFTKPHSSSLYPPRQKHCFAGHDDKVSSSHPEPIHSVPWIHKAVNHTLGQPMLPSCKRTTPNTLAQIFADTYISCCTSLKWHPSTDAIHTDTT